MKNSPPFFCKHRDRFHTFQKTQLPLEWMKLFALHTESRFLDEERFQKRPLFQKQSLESHKPWPQPEGCQNLPQQQKQRLSPSADVLLKLRLTGSLKALYSSPTFL